jgi:hypothetical protein
MPEETRYEKLFAALVAANYHGAKASTRYGGDWTDRVKWLEARQSAVLTKIPKLDDALDLLGQGGQPKDAETLWRHAGAAVRRAHALTHGPDGPMGDLSSEKAQVLEDPNRWLHIFGVLGELDLGKATFHIDSKTFDPVSGLSEFAATLTHPRRDNDTFDIWKSSVDPRRWQHVLPEMFALSKQIDDSLVKDRSETPVADRVKASTDPVETGSLLLENFPLFEVARLKLIGLPLTNFRNVLDIEFLVHKEDEKNGTIIPTYSLHESLTNTLLDLPTREGGIDVDSCGYGQSRVDLQEDTITVKAAKRIRFSAEADFAIELNLLALPFLEAWITELLIFGMAAGGIAARRPSRHPASMPMAAE